MKTTCPRAATGRRSVRTGVAGGGVGRDWSQLVGGHEVDATARRRRRTADHWRPVPALRTTATPELSMDPFCVTRPNPTQY